MTVTQAAKVIGCSPSTVRRAILSGKLKAKQIETISEPFYRWEITRKDAVKFKNQPKADNRGFPRGKKR